MTTVFQPTELEVLDRVDSTQLEMGRRLLSGGPVPGAILALDQTKGKGRFGREWISRPGDSMTMSLALTADHNHPAPWFLGMAVACVAAGILHAQLQWPNDLVIRGKKVGGILTELLPDNKGRRIPVIGIGLNLNQSEFPDEIRSRATSILIERGHTSSVYDVARDLLSRMSTMPDTNTWSELRPIWMMFDATHGKPYRLPNGSDAIAIGLGPGGELIASVDGETVTVLAADAIFGG
ncbi:MAG: biotin--[acetyl-CoA-carboxylase] ligase [Fimbriimonadaceae bacterium]|nr:biotin--[acetyl-CoA-carboxylase] ligase [Fimbriimonadaceae bacterium]